MNQLLEIHSVGGGGEEESIHYKQWVDFEEFKVGLVQFLEKQQQQQQQVQQVQQQDDHTGRGRCDSPPREVEPKFVVGRRRYGRRSRPELAATPSPTGDITRQVRKKKEKHLIYKQNLLLWARLIYGVEARARARPTTSLVGQVEEED